MAIQRVVVEIHFGVERQHAVVARGDQRIDFGERRVGGFKRAVKVGKEFRRFVHLLGPKPQAEGEFPSLKSLKADGRVHGFVEDFFRMLGGDRFDFDAAFARRYESGPGRRAVEHRAEVELPLHGQAFLDEQAPDEAALGARLRRYQLFPEHLARQPLRFVGASGELHPARFAAPSGVDLRFDDYGPAQVFGRGASLVGRLRHLASRDRNSKARQDLLRLILVDFHKLKAKHYDSGGGEKGSVS